jgi:hypothetical protein
MTTQTQFRISNPNADRPSPYDLSGLTFRLAGENERESMLNCRWKGYKQYGYVSPRDCWKPNDERAAQFICVDREQGVILGCLRMLSSSDGPLELEQYVDISEWRATGVSPAELTRFCVPLSKRLPAIKNGLMKLAWLHARKRGHTHFIITTQQKTKPGYDWLGFGHYLGRETTFLHPLISNNLHFVMTLDLIADTQAWADRLPELHRLFWKTEHPNIMLESDYRVEEAPPCT